MAHGGKRAKAGRKVGSKSRLVKENERASKAVDDGILPLDYMLSVMRDDKGDDSMRLEAAKSAAPYVHKKQPQDMNLGSTDGLPVSITMNVVGPKR